MIKAFLFDYGGVMTDGGRGTELTDRLGLALGIPPQKAYEFLGPVWDKYSRGTISEASLWAHIEQASGQRVALANRNIWNTWEHMTPLPSMLALVSQLKQAGYPVGLLSNIVPNTKRAIEANGGYDLFDFAVLSCELGTAKPDADIYKLALAKLPGVQPGEVLFTDDQERFLVPAAAMGIQTLLAESPEQVIAAIHGLVA
jgi:epoxide hydrolase-like predicted phosphatase